MSTTITGGHAGLVPAIRPAERCDLPALVAAKVKLIGAENGAGTAADAKAVSIVGGMAAGADSIDDPDVLRHGGPAKLFGGVRAPSAPGTFLRVHLGARASTPVGSKCVHLQSGRTHRPGAPRGRACQAGVPFGCTKVRGAHFQIVTVTTGTCAP
ncbi:TnpC [Streptomyces zinciresistens K42]|uniref:TnpC n=1 Tax=Streptomyces zinciresistens K42 TaxID=700597 RepID=G2G4R4_9ACTN|nr:TnpC [Streptomyces zinciresistens K42]